MTFIDRKILLRAFAAAAIFFLCTAVASAQSASLPLKGYFVPGRYMPLRIDAPAGAIVRGEGVLPAKFLPGTRELSAVCIVSPTADHIDIDFGDTVQTLPIHRVDRLIVAASARERDAAQSKDPAATVIESAEVAGTKWFGESIDLPGRPLLGDRPMARIDESLWVDDGLTFARAIDERALAIFAALGLAVLLSLAAMKHQSAILIPAIVVVALGIVAIVVAVEPAVSLTHTEIDCGDRIDFWLWMRSRQGGEAVLWAQPVPESTPFPVVASNEQLSRLTMEYGVDGWPISLKANLRRGEGVITLTRQRGAEASNPDRSAELPSPRTRRVLREYRGDGRVIEPDHAVVVR